MFAILARAPLQYERERMGERARQEGSHVWLQSPNGYRRLLVWWHDQADLPPWIVRKVLVKQAGLSEDEALDLLRG